MPQINLRDLTDESGFDPDAIAASLRTTKVEIAATLGLSTDALSRRSRISSVATQRRLREMVEILNRMQPHLGSALAAYAWYRSEPLPGFGGRTAEALVRDGHADWVRDYLDDAMAGGFA